MACTVSAAGLFWLAMLTTPFEDPALPDSPVRPVLPFSTFLIVLGVAATILAFLAFGWLGYRIYEARLPPWERRDRARHSRRR